MSLKDWLTQVLASLGYVPAPDVGEAVRQQRAVTRGPHSRKVDPLKRAFVEARAAMAHEVDMELLTTVDCADDRAAVLWLTGEGA